jgi:hypothetical protein
MEGAWGAEFDVCRTFWCIKRRSRMLVFLCFVICVASGIDFCILCTFGASSIELDCCCTSGIEYDSAMGSI